MDDLGDVSPSVTDQSFPQNGNIARSKYRTFIVGDFFKLFSKNALFIGIAPQDPRNWTVSDVTSWLQKCDLGQFAAAFEGIIRFYSIYNIHFSLFHMLLANEVDGSTVMSDSFDEAVIKELFPILKHRITFNEARKKLRYKP